MAEIVTVPERKARETARRRAAADAIIVELRGFAANVGGKFIVFGSAAEDRMSFDSDFDVVVDFPPETENLAVEFVEDICRSRNLPADIHPRSLASARFLARIATHVVTVS